MQMLNEVNNIDIAPHFRLSEFACPCCRQVILHPLLLKKLSKLREMVNRPVYITSGYRCPEFNLKAGGIKTSYHLLGLAADVRVEGMSVFELLEYAESIEFSGIGFYEKKNFLHLDVRPTKNTRWRG
ncbi:MAG: D-Ala-D-Ala carboxypeptidase family metallohydrolase [Candidatus Caldatribacteriota bacterium]